MPDKVDWEAIEREYRAGQLSVREIGRQHSIPESTIRKKAKAEGWSRDLTERVKEAVRSELVRSEGAEAMREGCVQEEKEIVKAAAARTIKLVQIHRADAKMQRQILADLIGELKARLSVIKEVRKVEVSEETGKPLCLSPFTLDELKDTSAISRNASTALKNLVTIERQAYGLDVKGDDGEGGQAGPQEIKVNIINFGQVVLSRTPARIP